MRLFACHATLLSSISRCVVVLSLAATLAPKSLALAQTAPLFIQPAQWPGCPVEIAARQRSASELREVPGALPGTSQGPRQGVTLTLKGNATLRISTAEIVVHGLSPKPRAISANGPEDTDVSRTFYLVNQRAAGFTSDVWMRGVSALRWIELKSITYSDGSEWHESAAAKCGIAPDPIVLVSAR